MIKAVLFDLDGTLLNTIEDIKDSVNIMLAKHGYPLHSTEEYKILVGGGFDTLIKKALPKEVLDDEKIVQQCFEEAKDAFSKNWDKKTAPYDGVVEMLEKLFKLDLKIGILSNKPHDFTLLTVKKFLPEFDFEFIQGVEADNLKKPDKEFALKVIKPLNISSSDVIYVGDTKTDMQLAKNASFLAIGVTWGFRKREELIENGADIIVNTPSELYKEIEKRVKK